MIEVGSYEAKTQLPKLLRQVAEGQRITITKHGIPVAMLVPVTPSPQVDHATVVEQLRSLRRGRRLGDLTLRDMIEEGRRF